MLTQSGDSPDSIINATKWSARDWLGAAVLFLATAAVVVWQNLRLGVLWDLSYILENAHRISLGDVPYRDFPFPYAPGTFLIQAAIIKITGRVFFHHIIYAALAGGLGTVIAWRILLNILRGEMAFARLAAFLLSAPLIVLGIYCIYPHPFYDPDCTLAILLCILLLQHAGHKGFPPLRAFLAGVALVVPLFIKQNTGLAFLGSAAVVVLALLIAAAWRRKRISGYASVFIGIVAAIAAAALLIQFTAGLANYWHWTIKFAAARRMPDLREMYLAYLDWKLLGWMALFGVGLLLLAMRKRVPLAERAVTFLAVAFMAAPFAWAVVYMFLDRDPSERAERLLALWPLVMVLSFALAVANLRRRANISAVLPFIVLGTVQGAFLSQQLWGSTYGLWPFLMILIAIMLVEIGRVSKEKPGYGLISLVCAVVISLLISGGAYLWSNERLEYVNVSEGDIARSGLPALAGLRLRGPWIPQFEELVQYADREIPREDGLLMIPGEDLFYYATGRHAKFPVLMFDNTVNPYSPEEILGISRERNIRWIVVKRDLQSADQPYDNKVRLLQLLSADFNQVESLDNYDVYKRKQ